MAKKVFGTFLSNYDVNGQIEDWCKRINGKEVDRSAPFLVIDKNGGRTIAVTSTAEVPEE